MDRVAGMEAEETMLRRIVALLYSLANLAEQAAVRSPASSPRAFISATRRIPGARNGDP